MTITDLTSTSAHSKQNATTKQRGFTILELVIVIAIIAILAAVLIPSLVNGTNNAKQDIVDIYNGDQTIRMVDDDTGEILYEGKESTAPDGYKLVHITIEDGIVVMYMEKKQTT